MNAHTRERPRAVAVAERGALIVGIAALVASKTADITTTVILAKSDAVYETNSIAASWMEGIGVLPATIILSLLAFMVIISAVELGVGNARKISGRWWPVIAVRLVGYGLPSAIWFRAAVHNAGFAGILLG